MTPSVAFTLFFDTLLIALCIFCLRKSADGYLLGRDTISILHWIYAVNALTFYLTLREFCKAIALVTMAKSRKLFLNFSNALNILSLVFLITSVLAIRLSVPLEVEASQNMRILITITTGLLWIRLIGMLKSINVKMATFVMAIVQVSKCHQRRCNPFIIIFSNKCPFFLPFSNLLGCIICRYQRTSSGLW